MPVAIEARIIDVLLTHLGAFPEQTPPIDIASRNAAFEPTSGKTFLAASVMFNTPVNRGVDDDSSTEFRGILQVTVAAPVILGLIEPLDLAGKVASHFERGTPLFGTGITIKIEGRPAVASPQQSTDRVRVPVSVNFSCFARPAG